MLIGGIDSLGPPWSREGTESVFFLGINGYGACIVVIDIDRHGEASGQGGEGKKKKT